METTSIMDHVYNDTKCEDVAPELRGALVARAPCWASPNSRRTWKTKCPLRTMALSIWPGSRTLVFGITVFARRRSISARTSPWPFVRSF